MRRSQRHLVLASSLCVVLAACDANRQTAMGGESAPIQGRISAMAPIVWACPLENWRRGDDDGCDPIATGTRIEIRKRNIHPEYPHGPFALIGYTHEGVQKMQYVIDLNVTPLGEDEPTVEELRDRVLKSVREAGRGQDAPPQK